MILIRKGAPPASLTTYRLRPDTSVGPPRAPRYDGPGFDVVKPDVRSALLAEQRRVCCYCTDRITHKTMKIEHRVAQSADESRALDWPNVFGACCGEIDNPAGDGAKILHCDSAKGSRPIAVDPTRASHIATLSYRNDGTLVSSQPAHQADIDDVLRLNVTAMCDRRRRELTKLQRVLRERHGAKALPRAGLQKLLDLHHAPRGDHAPFVGFLCWWLQRSLRKAV